jgi:hypothetical protein
LVPAALPARVLAAAAGDPAGPLETPLSPRKTFLLNLLDLLVLSCLAVSQPVFDLLAKNVEFLAARDSDFTDVVLLAAGVTFLVPLVLALVEFIAWMVGPKTQAFAHRAVMWALVALLLLPPSKPLYAGIGAWWIVALLLTAGIISQTYISLRSRGIALAYVSPIVLILAGLFLFHSPVRRFLQPKAGAAPVCPRVDATAPVVMVVFDELPLASLMDEQGRINSHRYPNFAALVRQATWYRNASTVTESTLHAVPAILDGNLPDPDSPALPDARGHPHSLFTLLGGSYGMNVVENNTRLCPEGLCAPSNTGVTRAERLSSLFSDLGVLYLYLLLPSDLTRPLPNITLSWEHFRFARARSLQPAQTDEDFDRMTAWENRPRLFAQFVESLQPRSRPTLNFLHILLPHAPWEFLPSGRKYALRENGIRGLVGINDRGIDPNQWNDDSWALEQAYQRHLLQVEMVDRLLGDLMGHLKSVNLFDPSLIVITADHGASFRSGISRRHPSPSNYADILSVPLFIKAPNQAEGEVTDRNVESIDILPTMADILGVRLPWPTDGRSARDSSRSPKGGKTVVVESGERFQVDARLPAVYESIRRKIAWFGHDPDDIYRIGPYAELLGKDTRSLLTTRSPIRCDLDGGSYYQNVDPDSDFVLANVCGRLSRRRQDPPAIRDLAVAINGTIRGVTRSYVNEDGLERFSSVLSDTHFRHGYNHVAVYLVAGTSDGLELAETESAEIPPYRWGDVLHFGVNGNAQSYKAGGWSTPEDQITWSDGRRAELVLPTRPPRDAIRLKLYAGVYLNRGKVDRQRVRLSVNRRVAAELVLSQPDFAVLDVTIPRDFFSDQERTVITFEMPDSIPPSSIGDGKDLRQLGIAVSWLSLGEQ